MILFYSQTKDEYTEVILFVRHLEIQYKQKAMVNKTDESYDKHLMSYYGQQQVCS